MRQGNVDCRKGLITMKNKYSPAQDMREKEALYAKIEEQKALIDYLAMMADIDLDDEDEWGDEDDGEE